MLISVDYLTVFLIRHVVTVLVVVTDQGGVNTGPVIATELPRHLDRLVQVESSQLTARILTRRLSEMPVMNTKWVVTGLVHVSHGREITQFLNFPSLCVRDPDYPRIYISCHENNFKLLPL